jgi:methyl-accepting chemotaxis protein
MIIIFIGAAVILTIIVVIIAKNIVTPIKLITEDLQKISNKDLKINEE